MNYGMQIGYKFNQDGTPRKYPGNTIIADVKSSNPAYPIIGKLRRELSEEVWGKSFIFLPEDSYHVTIIRGMNDYVRESEYWPLSLPLDAPMTEVDDYFVENASRVNVPKRIHMKFGKVKIDDHDVRICLTPWDEEQDRILREYRDEVAEKIGLRLPGHDSYTYHITLAYVLWIPEEHCRREMGKKIEEMNVFLARQDGFWLSSPQIRFYNDMLNFYTQRIPRT